MTHFNKLSPEVAELLAILAEECGEVVQRIGKILRHGVRVNPYSDSDQRSGKLNTSYLEEELTDVYALVELLSELGLISEFSIREGILAKRDRLARPGILHHSTLLGGGGTILTGDNWPHDHV